MEEIPLNDNSMKEVEGKLLEIMVKNCN